MGRLIEEYNTTIEYNNYVATIINTLWENNQKLQVDYENRLKADMVAMLTEIKDEISSNYLIDADTGKIISGRFPNFKAQKLLDRINNEINKLREGEL